MEMDGVSDFTGSDGIRHGGDWNHVRRCVVGISFEFRTL